MTTQDIFCASHGCEELGLTEDIGDNNVELHLYCGPSEIMGSNLATYLLDFGMNWQENLENGIQQDSFCFKDGYQPHYEVIKGSVQPKLWMFAKETKADKQAYGIFWKGSYTAVADWKGENYSPDYSMEWLLQQPEIATQWGDKKYISLKALFSLARSVSGSDDTIRLHWFQCRQGTNDDPHREIEWV